MIYKPEGRMRCKATAVAATQQPFTTQQIGVDNSLIATMRAVTGSNKNKGSAMRV